MKCPTCGETAAKHGKDRNGLQRLRCAACKKTFLEPHALANKKTSVEDAAKVLRMLLEGMSVRSCERLTGMHRDTILRIMLDAGESCRSFMEKAIRKHPVQCCELDEQWAFIGCKQKRADAMGYQKGLDYDRETGRVKVSIKEFIPDFIFARLGLAIEVKLSKDRAKSKEIVDEVNADIQAYSKKYPFMLFIIYDLGSIRDVDEFKHDLEKVDGVSVVIVKH